MLIPHLGGVFFSSMPTPLGGVDFFFFLTVLLPGFFFFFGLHLAVLFF